ncbi:MAG: cobalt ABC transporter permease [Desulfomonilaceae bacterium]
MKKVIIITGLLFALVLTALVCLADTDNKWPGVDEAVVQKFAENAGRPAREPFLNFGEGDIQLFFFLIAGAVGGFVAGYYYRDLFTPQPSWVKNPSNA